jgi:hypothetical protein
MVIKKQAPPGAIRGGAFSPRHVGGVEVPFPIYGIGDSGDSLAEFFDQLKQTRPPTEALDVLSDMLFLTFSIRTTPHLPRGSRLLLTDDGGLAITTPDGNLDPARIFVRAPGVFDPTPISLETANSLNDEPLPYLPAETAPAPVSAAQPKSRSGRDADHNWEGAANYVDEMTKGKPLPRHENGEPNYAHAIALMTAWFTQNEPPAPTRESFYRWFKQRPDRTRLWWG